MKKIIILGCFLVLIGMTSLAWAFPPVPFPPAGSTGAIAEVYGSGWNGDLNGSQKNDIYDYLHTLDTNDDGKIDTIDATLWATKQSVSAVGIYDPTPDTDQTVTCIVCNAGQTAGENLAFGNTVYKAADGKWYKTDSDAEATCSQLDIQVVVTAAGIAADATGTLMSDGWIRDDSFGLSTVGAPLYFQGDTVGDPGWFTETPPSGSGYVVRKMGSTSSTVAVGGMDVIRFKPESSYSVVP